MHDKDDENTHNQRHLSATGTSLVISACGVVVGGIIVLSGFGAFIKSAGGEGISIFGTNLVNGLAQPARKIKEIATRYLIVLPPSFSMAYQVV